MVSAKFVCTGHHPPGLQLGLPDPFDETEQIDCPLLTTCAKHKSRIENKKACGSDMNQDQTIKAIRVRPLADYAVPHCTALHCPFVDPSREAPGDLKSPKMETSNKNSSNQTASADNTDHVAGACQTRAERWLALSR